jgi:arabinogalactan endo-1,4-beta-galactosidase
MSRTHRPTRPLAGSRRRLGVATGAFALTAALCGGLVPTASATAASGDDATRASRTAVANPGFENVHQPGATFLTFCVVVARPARAPSR